MFDKWIAKENPNTPFERYADDIVIHCVNIKEALRLLEKVKKRFKDCKLELNQEKSKIVYCRNNQKRQPPFKVRYQKFDFLGYTFKPRIVKERGKIKLGFSPAISQKEYEQDSKRVESDGFPSLGTLPNQQDCRIAQTQNTGLDKLLWQVPNERNAESVPLIAHTPFKMDTQLISQVQETTLGQGIQVFAEPVTELSEIV